MFCGDSEESKYVTRPPVGIAPPARYYCTNKMCRGVKETAYIGTLTKFHVCFFQCGASEIKNVRLCCKTCRSPINSKTLVKCGKCQTHSTIGSTHCPCCGVSYIDNSSGSSNGSGASAANTSSNVVNINIDGKSATSSPAPVITQAPPQPVYAQPAPQPVYVQPAPQTVYVQPTPQPVYAQPAPQPVYAQPAPQPMPYVTTISAPPPVPTYHSMPPSNPPHYSGPYYR